MYPWNFRTKPEHVWYSFDRLFPNMSSWLTIDISNNMHIMIFENFYFWGGSHAMRKIYLKTIGGRLRPPARFLPEFSETCPKRVRFLCNFTNKFSPTEIMKTLFGITSTKKVFKCFFVFLQTLGDICSNQKMLDAILPGFLGILPKFSKILPTFSG